MFYFYDIKLCLFLLLIWIKVSQQICTLPPDFWCESEDIALKCTGSLKYCESYKRNIENNKNKINMKASFEALCSDSMAFVFNRLSNTILSNKESLETVNFEAVPWGLAKRKENGQVQCQHGIKECQFNTLFSCSNSIIENDYNRAKFFSCGMKQIINNVKAKDIINKCGILKSILTKKETELIENCINGNKGIQLQEEAEIITKKILNSPNFVPQILIGDNDKTMDMQIYQLLLKEKPSIWKASLKNIKSGGNKINNCTTPPDFWCSTEKISNECFTNEMCLKYKNEILDKKIDLNILYDPEEPVTQRMISESLKDTFIDNYAYNIQDVFTLKLTPIWNEWNKNDCNNRVTKGCRNIAVYHCISKHIDNLKTSTRLQMCLMNSKLNKDKLAFDSLNDDCRKKFFNLPLPIKNTILKCTHGQNYNSLIMEYEKFISTITPDKMTKEPWLLINSYSLSNAQNYLPILDKMMCIWYNGKNHDRQFCGRCEYEESRC
ncbi:Gamma-interferon-inducible lysosomal thiol reductase [Strongyloides ratti]|uniref:Gamma-interferon-inducible lysosomal thiol reductase n=1 Tax=Strongyloides ratti TaxID=34506 RepID=A0A090KPS4_STRRB|nr:Gamma-interferon-inducible lysosomal thiol reductase [Strongyloides ratti]CEF59384.1 Gamma-interferon-inducible lysosomal thiol reductase [Strongyloides ratti]